MPSLPRLLACLGCLAATLNVLPAMAAEDAIHELRRITKEAGEELEEISLRVRDLEYRTRAGSTGNTTGNRGFSSAHHGIIDLQRSARRLAQLGSEASSRVSRCDKSVREVALDFQREARTISNLAGRISDTRGSIGAEMSFGQLDFAVQRAYRVLPTLAAVDSCAVGDGTVDPADDGEEEEEEEEEEAEEQEKKEQNKGTEDYEE